MSRSDAIRETLLRAVQAAPGIHLNQLARQTGLVRGTLYHHMRRLESQGLLRLQRDGGLVRLYRAAPVPAQWLALLHEPVPQRILARLHARPGAGVRDLSSDLCITQLTISRHLGGLVRAGLVERAGSYRSAYYLTPEGTWPLRILASKGVAADGAQATPAAGPQGPRPAGSREGGGEGAPAAQSRMPP